MKKKIHIQDFLHFAIFTHCKEGMTTLRSMWEMVCMWLSLFPLLLVIGRISQNK